jgi:hypothetical protein
MKLCSNLEKERRHFSVKKNILPLLAFSLCFFVLSLSPLLAQKMKSSYDKAAPFEKLKTFAFKPGLLLINEDHDRFDELFVKAMREELQARGLTEKPEKPDLYVTYYAGYTGLSGGGGDYSVGAQINNKMYQQWEAPPTMVGAVSTSLVEGTVMVEMADASSNKLIWQSRAQGAVKNQGKPEKQAENIPGLMNKIFKSCPMKGKP